jgi:hypothetical protein
MWRILVQGEDLPSVPSLVGVQDLESGGSQAIGELLDEPEFRTT